MNKVSIRLIVTHHFTKKAKAKITFDLDWEGANSITSDCFVADFKKYDLSQAKKQQLKYIWRLAIKNRVAIKVTIKVSHKNVVSLHYEMSYLIMSQCEQPAMRKGEKSIEWSPCTFQVQPTWEKEIRTLPWHCNFLTSVFLQKKF